MSEKRRQSDIDGGPAYPVDYDEYRYLVDGEPKGELLPEAGLSKREWFAGQALTGIIAGLITTTTGAPPKTADEVAEECYRLADAMIAARK